MQIFSLGGAFKQALLMSAASMSKLFGAAIRKAICTDSRLTTLAQATDKSRLPLKRPLLNVEDHVTLNEGVSNWG